VNVKPNEKVTFERKELVFTKIQIEQAGGKRFVSGNIDGAKVEESDDAIKIVFNPQTSKGSFDTNQPTEKKQILIGLGEPTVTKSATASASSPAVDNKQFLELQAELNALKTQNEQLLKEIGALKVNEVLTQANKVSLENNQAKATKQVEEKKVEVVEPAKKEAVVSKPEVVEPVKKEVIEAPAVAKVESKTTSVNETRVFAMQQILNQNNLGLIFFEKFSHNFKEDYTSELSKISDFINKNPKSKIVINSYVTSEAEADNYKPVLANVRAIKVKEFLVETYKINPDKLEIVIVDQHKYDETLKGCISFSTKK